MVQPSHHRLPCAHPILGTRHSDDSPMATQPFPGHKEPRPACSEAAGLRMAVLGASDGNRALPSILISVRELLTEEGGDVHPEQVEAGAGAVPTLQTQFKGRAAAPSVTRIYFYCPP